jgi:hypothetical protein
LGRVLRRVMCPRCFLRVETRRGITKRYNVRGETCFCSFLVFEASLRKNEKTTKTRFPSHVIPLRYTSPRFHSQETSRTHHPPQYSSQELIYSNRALNIFKATSLPQLWTWCLVSVASLFFSIVSNSLTTRFHKKSSKYKK